MTSATRNSFYVVKAAQMFNIIHRSDGISTQSYIKMMFYYENLTFLLHISSV